MPIARTEASRYDQQLALSSFLAVSKAHLEISESQRDPAFAPDLQAVTKHSWNAGLLPEMPDPWQDTVRLVTWNSSEFSSHRVPTRQDHAGSTLRLNTATWNFALVCLILNAVQRGNFREGFSVQREGNAWHPH